MFFLLKDQRHQGSPKEGRVPQVVDEVNQSHMAYRPPVAIRLGRGRRSCKACFLREPGGGPDHKAWDSEELWGEFLEVFKFRTQTEFFLSEGLNAWWARMPSLGGGKETK